MKFERVLIHITNVDDEFANVKVEFDPPLPDDPEDIEEQPCLTLLDAMLESIGAEEQEVQEWLQ
jgi:hypothetical protein